MTLPLNPASIPTLAIWPIYRAIRASMDQGTKRCGVLAINTTARQVCLQKVKLETLVKMLKVMKKQSPKTIPEIQRKIKKLQFSMKKNIEKLAVAGKEARNPSNRTKIF